MSAFGVRADMPFCAANAYDPKRTLDGKPQQLAAFNASKLSAYQHSSWRVSRTKTHSSFVFIADRLNGAGRYERPLGRAIAVIS
jgi:hypothetical protein